MDQLDPHERIIIMMYIAVAGSVDSTWKDHLDDVAIAGYTRSSWKDYYDDVHSCSLINWLHLKELL